MKIKALSLVLLFSCAISFAGDAKIWIDRVVVDGEDTSNEVVIRSMSDVPECETEKWGYHLYHIPLEDDKAKYIQSIALTAFSTNQKVRVYYTTDPAKHKATMEGLSKCHITSFSIITD